MKIAYDHGDGETRKGHPPPPVVCRYIGEIGTGKDDGNEDGEQHGNYTYEWYMDGERSVRKIADDLTNKQ